LAKTTIVGGAADPVAALKASLPRGTKVIEVDGQQAVQIDVDVNGMTIPYTVVVDGDVLIKSLVDRRESSKPLATGTHSVTWAFAHTEKGWKHKISLTHSKGTEFLEDRSEANKDPDHSVGITFVVVR
jgi:hypothetical protein